MLAQEPFLEHKSMHDTTDESDETLSLCDLPLYGDWEEDLSAESQGSTSMSSSSDSDYFEFFSHELIPSAACLPPENIIFCGKIIPHKKPDASDTVPSKEAETKQPASIKKKRGWSMFRWRLGSRRGSKKKDQHHTSKKTSNSKKQGKGYELPLHKMSILTSSSSGKARWHLLLTGISKFYSGVDLKDMRSRQSRRHNHSPPPSPTLKIKKPEQEKATSTGSSMLWEVIRVLSCGGNHHPNAMVAGPMSCNRLE